MIAKMATDGSYNLATIENATFQKTTGQNLNVASSGVDMTWDTPAIRNTVRDLVRLNATEFSLGIGIYLVTIEIVLETPVNDGNRHGLLWLYLLNGVIQGPRTYSDIAEPSFLGFFNGDWHFILEITSPGTLLRINSRQARQSGTYQADRGEIYFVRLA